MIRDISQYLCLVPANITGLCLITVNRVNEKVTGTATRIKELFIEDFTTIVSGSVKSELDKPLRGEIFTNIMAERSRYELLIDTLHNISCMRKLEVAQMVKTQQLHQC